MAFVRVNFSAAAFGNRRTSSSRRADSVRSRAAAPGGPRNTTGPSSETPSPRLRATSSKPARKRDAVPLDVQLLIGIDAAIDEHGHPLAVATSLPMACRRELSGQHDVYRAVEASLQGGAR